MECIIGLKNGGVKYFTLPEKCESYKLLQKAHEYIDIGNLNYADARRYVCLTLKAVINAPKYTKFRYDASEKRYTRREAVDYILNYGLDDEGNHFV